MLEKQVILTVFAAILAYLAYRSWRRTRTYEDFNLAGRKTGLFPMVCTLGAAEFNTATLIGGASVAYMYGTVGLYYTSLIFIFVFGIYAVTVAQPYRRLRISTIAEFFERRFHGPRGEATRAVASAITLTLTWMLPPIYLAGLSVITTVLLGIDPKVTVVGLVLFCLVLALGGGFMTAISFDVVAYVMILVFIPVVFVIGWTQADGLSGLSNVFDPQYLSFSPVWDLEAYGFAAVLTWGFQNIMSYIAAPWYGQRMFSARSAKVARTAMVINTVLITLLYGLVAGTTMMARVLVPDLKSPEEALPRLVVDYAPSLLQGLILVMLLLVGTSTMIAIWNSAVSIATNDIARRYIVPGRSEGFYVKVGRGVFLALGLSTLVVALTIVGNIMLVLTYISVYSSLLAVPILAGLYWKRFTTNAALAAMVSGAIYVTIGLVVGFPYHLISPIGFAISVVVGIVVTLAGPKQVPAEVEDFFLRVHGRSEGERGGEKDMAHV
ncbi:SSS family solute:Na+ symporter [Prauserella sediminis]|uniref:SSS family solute:Na+ symporter n=1 Tax=Prauserella sediminis TaxID=577680 RepID=A0A839XPB1_9PSEU|nr:sodium:solute symporter family protein [Prauserella sediminis]MBB3664517.1 SSS family solute:Na+ symporter [Prauserella sediminis]